ncbi:unnamed protein product [Nezara viridula]|uniref:Uncharacterized protein n=1 Tax=Nezara viridula TaxID=85310 RepID=A0A9P0H5Y9_NEZVI|nr:unnamed protein product [Nezara viridula]
MAPVERCASLMRAENINQLNPGAPVLVGAPKAQTDQPGVTKGGAVYSCDINSGSSCSQIPFDLNGK